MGQRRVPFRRAGLHPAMSDSVTLGWVWARAFASLTASGVTSAQVSARLSGPRSVWDEARQPL